MKDQDILRDQVKKLKWQQDISYKEIAEDLLDINYHSFINWKRGIYDLSQDRARQLEEYIYTIIE